MTNLNIYLSPFAYYVRIDVDDLEEQKKQSTYKKWIDNRKGMLMYEFIEFERLDKDWGDEVPLKTTQLGIVGSRLLCYNPFVHKYSSNQFILEPSSIDFNEKNGLILYFPPGYTEKIDRSSKYYSGNSNTWIDKINFRVDESGSTLRETIYFSNKFEKLNTYHLISKSILLFKPTFYSHFDF